MSDQPACTNCGTLLPEDAPAGLCPQCLVRAGLEQEDWAAGADLETPESAGSPSRTMQPGEEPLAAEDASATIVGEQIDATPPAKPRVQPSSAAPMVPAMPTLSVPFSLGLHGVTAARGLLRYDADGLTMEYDVDAHVIHFYFFAGLQPGFMQTVVPLPEIAALELRHTWWAGNWIQLQTHSIRALAEVPTSNQGCAVLRVARRDADAARRLVDAVQPRLAHSFAVAPHKPLPTSSGPSAAPAKSALPAKSASYGGPQRPTRFSRKAIVGACWAPLFLLVLVMFFWVNTVSDGPVDVAVTGRIEAPARDAGRAPVQVEASGDGEHASSSESGTRGEATYNRINRPSRGQPTSALQILLMVLAAVGFIAPLGTTILGMMAIREIRESRGGICGMPLALADALLFPLLLLDALLVVFAAMGFVMGAQALGYASASWMSTAVVVWIMVPVCLYVDFVIAHDLWRRVTRA